MPRFQPADVVRCASGVRAPRGERRGFEFTQLAVARPFFYLPDVHAPVSTAMLSATTISTPRCELAKRRD
jgi:hypothetical protein